jgi:predicted nucleotide-binding protein
VKKEKTYIRTRFCSAAIEEAHRVFESIHPRSKTDVTQVLSVSTGTVTWEYDDIDEFLAALPGNEVAKYYRNHTGSGEMRVAIYEDHSTVSVALNERAAIEKILNIFERYAPDCVVPEGQVKEDGRAIRIFIGHGRSSQWRDLKDHLQEKHGYEVVAYEIGSRTGHTIRDILEDMLNKSSCAFLVLSAEDQMADGTFHARQNVIHETGLFQGRLGFSRAIVLREEGAEEFSNLGGIQEIRFGKERIRETFGDVLAVVRREFGPNA